VRPPLTAAAARRVLLLVSFTRWFPVGLAIGVTTLIPLQRGIGLAELGLIFAVQGFVVLALELPTGGLADAVGRRPVLLVAGAVAVASGLLYITADTVGAFAAALLLQGVFRALDSGPLESWYVDTAQAADAQAPVARGLGAAGTVTGLAIAAGSLLSGGLVAWHPFPGTTALEGPYWIAIGCSVVHLIVVALLVREPARARRGFRRAVASAAEAPRTVADGVRLLGRNRVLLALVAVEVFWSVGMIAFETLLPVRLSELLGDEAAAGAVMGPVSAAAWGLFAVGSFAATRAADRLGVGWTALAARALNGAMIVVMGLATGPAGLLTAFLITYTLHGAAGPVHATLLHRQAESRNRTTVLSMNSMVAGGSFSLGLLALGPLAEHSGTAVAIVAAGAFSILGAVLYLPAIRAERASRAAESGRQGDAGPASPGPATSTAEPAGRRA
jgi:MFS family permease